MTGRASEYPDGDAPIARIGSLSPTTWVFLILSGLATGGSWICYFEALSTGPIDKVVPIDKSSAVLSAVFAALTSILGKVGIDGVESNLGTAIRTCVVLVMSWGIVFARGKGQLVCQVKGRELLFLVLSGIAAGASWLCYYYAIQTGIVSVVVQLDRLSILMSVFFAWIVFHERLNKRSGTGLALIVAGTVALTAFA